MESLPLGERLAMDKEWQRHWYRHVGQFVSGKSVLDAGAGTGYGIKLLQDAGASKVEGFDLVTLNDQVKESCIENYADQSWDMVLAVDVIEHVEDDRGFLAELLRVANEAVFFSTPNWNVSKAKNPYHVREYTPKELEALIRAYGFDTPWTDHRIWVSNHKLEITTRMEFDERETWHNHAVLLEKGK
jgi:2-polyprenyl-3-methyl-5-hydroxy-6-metoxy-1,4-benzoquinol methylase